MKKCLVFIFMLLTSCSSSEMKFHPEVGNLQNARVGKFYQQYVVLTFQGSGEVVSLSSSNFRAEVTPDNSGLNIEPDFSSCENNPSERCGNYNKAVIKGIPKTKGVITVEIVAKTYASMYSKSQVFVKKYQIAVD
ncbi:hypothetical protein [Cronobacter sakazakii]|uniref:hypothetical protein n=2 Tax=Cronobacter sakazakii TaxID=28141 RepID=UPI001ED90A7D|nr:hypothetical protein [Cronobacter sakazakii]MDT3569405.1 hypothetical protein [Cronobacter sakazakii]